MYKRLYGSMNGNLKAGIEALQESSNMRQEYFVLWLKLRIQ